MTAEPDETGERCRVDDARRTRRRGMGRDEVYATGEMRPTVARDPGFFSIVTV